MEEGGQQEIQLSEFYLQQASKLHFTHPNVANMVEDIAQYYIDHAKREDTIADLRKKGVLTHCDHIVPPPVSAYENSVLCDCSSSEQISIL
ncbi:MAG: hypothetical protein OFPI_30580 [Osedax symbiont Rs2]|nr:MAG: hypothetical protein OFPI_30580 [Osedax symbiont Rs2]